MFNTKSQQIKNSSGKNSIIKNTKEIKQAIKEEIKQIRLIAFVDPSTIKNQKDF